MADQGRWFKLWISALSDPDLDNLPVADFGRWAKLGAFIKAHGTNGTVSLSPPSRTLVSHLQLADFSALKTCIEGMPGFTVSGETNIIVTSSNWAKYQGDFSSPRVRKFREMKRSKRRREERRGEETRREVKPPGTFVPAPPPLSTGNGFATWPPEWAPIQRIILATPLLQNHAAWIDDLAWWRTMDTWLDACPKPLDALLSDVVAYLVTQGWKPLSKRSLRQKLHNCLRFAAERAQREDQRRSQTL